MCDIFAVVVENDLLVLSGEISFVVLFEIAVSSGSRPVTVKSLWKNASSGATRGIRVSAWKKNIFFGRTSAKMNRIGVATRVASIFAEC